MPSDGILKTGSTKEAVTVKCSKCGNEIPSQSKFCLTCGESIISNRTTNISEAPESRKKKTGLWAAITGLAIVAIILALKLHGMRVMQATPVPNPQQTPVVNAVPIPGGPQPNVLDTNVEKTPIEKPQPPADVVAYIEHLKKVEKFRQDVCARELNDLIATAPEMIAKAFSFDEDIDDEKSGTSEMAGKAGQYSKEWQQIGAYFLSIKPPQTCAALAGKYYDSLREFIIFMNGIQDAVGKTDVAKLKQIQRDQVSVDQKLISADQELAQVCNQYGIEKSFSIQADSSKTPILGF